MISQHKCEQCESRRGVTAIDIIVTAFCFVCLLALVLPGCNQAYSIERLERCRENLRRLARAAIDYSATNKARPAQGYYGIVSTAGSPTVFESRSWVVGLLPFMEQAAIKEQWSNDRPWSSAEAGIRGRSNLEISKTHLPRLVCPSDDSADENSPSLSYVINAGIGDLKHLAFAYRSKAAYQGIGHSPLIEPFDWNQNGQTPSEDGDDIKVTADACVTWPLLENHKEHELAAKLPALAGLEQIFDGPGVTILFTENINAGSVKGQELNSWSNPQIANCAFFMPISSELVGTQKLRAKSRLLEWVDESGGNPYMNQSKTNSEGNAPFPNSGHPGLAFVAFCDGSVMAISDKIQDQVYLQLITPNGTRLRPLIHPGGTIENLMIDFELEVPAVSF